MSSIPPNSDSPDETPAAGAGKTSSEVPCRHCGESVRVGLVRCWNCGNFMRDDIARRYQQMLASERPVIYSESEEESEAQSYTAADRDFTTDYNSDSDQSSDDDDFEMDTPLQEASPPKPAPAASPEPPPSAQPAPQAEAEPETIPLASSEDPVEPPAAKPVAEQPGSRETQPPPDRSHSEDTGGDVLLDIALREESEARRRRKRTPKSSDGFFVNCPNTDCNALIEVRERHRGLVGKCPKCHSPYLVPTKVDPPAPSMSAGDRSRDLANDSGGEVDSSGSGWTENILFHRIVADKVKVKPGSLEGQGIRVDLGFSSDGMVLVEPPKENAGVFGIGAVTAEDQAKARSEIRSHIAAGGEFTDIPAAVSKLLVPTEALPDLRVIYPTPVDQETVFAEVPVFGDHRVVVQLPFETDKGESQYLIFPLSKLRQFLETFESATGLDHLAAGLPVPLEDSYTDLTCHYTDQMMPVLDYADWSVTDPVIETLTIGWQCGACQLVISEDARKKEKIGGKTPKGLAKAKCPKCENTFGENPLVTRTDRMAQLERDGESSEG